MNSQEREQLTRFLGQLVDARGIEKNAEADTLIREAAAKQPDATYLLVQRSLLLEQALNGAKAQIAQLQSQLQSSQSAGRSSFLGSNPWAAPAESAPPANAVPGAGNYQVPRAAAAAAPVAPAVAGGGGGSGFLGNIATTAAGVVAGSFLFQGIESLMGHHQSPMSSWGGGNGMPGGENFTENTTINNYYGSDPDQSAGRDQYDDSFLASDADDDYGSSDDSDDSSWV